MIITEAKPLQEIIDSLTGFSRIFLVGCGECATTCKTGGEPEVLALKSCLEAAGKTVVGLCIPGAPCVAAQTKTELAKNMQGLRQAEALVVLACGLGVQSVRENNRLGQAVMPACNSICGAVVDAQGNFLEKCSLCGDCVLALTEGICPVTLCAKGLLNGPCGGMDKGKCETDKNKDCAWALIYQALAKSNNQQRLKAVLPPKDHKKSLRPRVITRAQ